MNFQVIPWKSWAALAAAVLAALFLLNREHRAKTDALRDAEAARLALGQQIVTNDETRRQLQGSVAQLLSENADLAAAVADAKRAAPDAHPVGAARLQTAPVKVTGDPPKFADDSDPAAHPPAPPPCDKPLVASFTCPGAPACVLAQGDTASLKVDEVLLGTAKGNQIITGTAEFWRDLPLPRAKLASGKFASALSQVAGLAPDSPPRWGAMLQGSCSAQGCGPGAALLFPPASVLGLRLEAQAGFLLGPLPAATAGLGVRW